MFKTLFIAICLLPALAGTAQKVKVTGKIKGLDDQLVLTYFTKDTVEIDTVKVTGGKFTWQASLPEPQKIYMFFPQRMMEFFAENGNITINGNIDSLDALRITGSKIQQEADAFEKSIKEITDQENKIYGSWNQGTPEDQVAREEKLEELRAQRRARAEKYIAEHPQSAYSVSMVYDRATMGEYGEIKKLYDLLSPAAQQTIIGSLVGKRLEVLKRSAIGERMLDFTQNDTEGKPVHFSDFAGKYVFVDFWASWCGPCRAENPNVLKAYNKYKDKNFTVVGVSLDDDGDRWKKAIKDDNMPWTQVSDLKGWQNEVSTYYGIQAIPSTLLVDPQGKIIAKDLRGEALNKKLAELFD